MNFSDVYEILCRLTKNASRLSNEDMENVAELTFVKEIFSYWPSNDEGDDVDLYTGVSLDGVTPRYFLQHLSRDWNGGWTSNDTYMWYEISQQEYMKFCENDYKL